MRAPIRGRTAHQQRPSAARRTPLVVAPRAQAAQAPPATAVASAGSPYQRLSGIKVIRASDGERLALTTLWGPTGRAVVAFGRELAIQLRRDVKPALDEKGVKLFLVSIGTHERSKEFAGVTGFPQDCLFADPGSETYAALGLTKSVAKTLFSYETPLAIKRRMDQGATGDLQDILSRWIPWLPPKSDQSFQQGGMFVFEGEALLFSHFDPATSVHADFAQVLGVATANLGASCEATACELPPPSASRPQP